MSIKCQHCGKKCRLCQTCHKTRANYGAEEAIRCKKCKEESDKPVFALTALCIKCKNTQRAYGKPGEKAQHCGKCKEDGEIIVNLAYCEVCLLDKQYTIACFAKQKGEKPSFCTKHKPETGVDVKNKKCENCEKSIASYTHEGKLKYCAKCAKNLEIENEIRNGKVPYCITCNKTIATFGIDKPLFCKLCRDPEIHKDVRSTKCEKCGKLQPCYGVAGNYPTRCAGCKEPSHVLIRHACSCGKGVKSYGAPNGVPERCHNCKMDTDVNTKFVYYECIGCNQTFSKIEGGKCDYCVPNSKYRTFEKDVAYFIKTMLIGKNEKVLELITNSSFEIGKECGSMRPDIRLDCFTYFIIIEVDENQHKSKNYDTPCERDRHNNLTWALGLPVVLIRYNPSEYKNKFGEKMTTPALDRKAKLLDTINDLLKKDLQDPQTIYLFYDEPPAPVKKTQALKVAAFSNKKECVGKFLSISEAARRTDIHPDGISRAVHDENATSGGFKWRQIDTDEEFNQLQVVQEINIAEIKGRGTRVGMVSIDGKIVAHFANASQAAKRLDLAKKSIQDCLRNPSRKSCGYYWKHLKDDEEVPDKNISETHIQIALSRKRKR